MEKYWITTSSLIIHYSIHMLSLIPSHIPSENPSVSYLMIVTVVWIKSLIFGLTKSFYYRLTAFVCKEIPPECRQIFLINCVRFAPNKNISNPISSD